MFRKKYSKYISLGVTLLLVVMASVVFVVIFSNLNGFFGVVSSFVRVISFLIYGALFAYLMNPVMGLVEKLVKKLLGKTRLTERTVRRIGRAAGIIVSLIVLVLIVYAIIALILPQIIDSLKELFDPDRLMEYYNQFTAWFAGVVRGTSLERFVDPNDTQLMDKLQSWASGQVENRLLPMLQNLVTELYSVLTNLLLGLAVAVYLLASKEKFLAQAKKLVVAMFRPKHADRVLEIARRTNSVFGGFIFGKLIDSLIIGIITYFGLLILRTPYPVLLAVIVGVGNIIPVFGPLVSGVIGTLLVVLISPTDALYFAIFVLVLQQIDGNYIGPKILGDRLGLSNFWVLFAIALFGGIFGFKGMVFGLPIFAVIYSIVRDAVERSLRKKKKPLDTEAYYGILTVADLGKYKQEFGEPTVFFSEDTFDTEYDPDEEYAYIDTDET